MSAENSPTSPLAARARHRASDPVALVQTTLPDLQAAQKMARALVETHDAACVQLTPIMSVFRWEGQLDDAKEFRLDIKTSPSHLTNLLLEIERTHPYDVPEILVHAGVTTTQAYGRWVAAELTGSPTPP